MTIRVYVADLPPLETLIPALRRMHETRIYSNFGPLESEFRDALARWLDSARPPIVATASSGTAALTLTLRALDLPAGGNVLIPALTFPATAAAVIAAGLQPVLADVDPTTWTMTPDIAANHRFGICAVVPVATFGVALDAVGWDAFAEAMGLPVVFDAAAGLVRQPMPERCAAIFSLHATKPLGVGEGGLVASRDADLIARVRQLSNFGFDNDLVRQPGGNAKLSEYHAAVGLAQLGRAGEIRRGLAALHRDYLTRLPASLNPAVEGAAMVVAVPGRAREVADALAGEGIETRRWYQPDLTRHPAFARCARAGDLAATASLADRLIGLPFHAFLKAEDVGRVCERLEMILAVG